MRWRIGLDLAVAEIFVAFFDFCGGFWLEAAEGLEELRRIEGLKAKVCVGATVKPWGGNEDDGSLGGVRFHLINEIGAGDVLDASVKDYAAHCGKGAE